MFIMRFSLLVSNLVFYCLGKYKFYNSKIGAGSKLKQGTHICRQSVVGKHTFVGRNCSLDQATIGNYCSIAPNVFIGPGVHSIDFISTSQRIATHLIGHELVSNKTIIGSDVWIGVNSVIMQGVKVGDGAVIGANSVVTKDVEEYSIVAGVPAKQLRMRFPKEKIKILKESKWFDLDLDQARAKVEQLWVD